MVEYSWSRRLPYAKLKGQIALTLQNHDQLYKNDTLVSRILNFFSVTRVALATSALCSRDMMIVFVEYSINIRASLQKRFQPQTTCRNIHNAHGRICLYFSSRQLAAGILKQSRKRKKKKKSKTSSSTSRHYNIIIVGLSFSYI